MTPERMRFSPRDDIILLREVISFNPFADKGVWPDLSVRVRNLTNKKFTTRAMKDHLKHLLLLWEKEDWRKLRRSGCEEIYVEKEFLIEQVSELRECYKAIKGNDPDVTALEIESLERKAAAITQATFCHPVPVEAEAVLLCDEETPKTQLRQQHTMPSQDIHVSMISQPPHELHSEPQIMETKPSITVAEPKIAHFAKKLGLLPVSLPPSSIPDLKRKHAEPTISNSALRFLEKKSRRETSLQEAKLTLKERELELKEARLKLDREIFELDKREREGRLKLESDRNQQFAKQQDLLIELLKKRLCDSCHNCKKKTSQPITED